MQPVVSQFPWVHSGGMNPPIMHDLHILPRKNHTPKNVSSPSFGNWLAASQDHPQNVYEHLFVFLVSRIIILLPSLEFLKPRVSPEPGEPATSG